MATMRAKQRSPFIISIRKQTSGLNRTPLSQMVVSIQSHAWRRKRSWQRTFILAL